MSYAHEGVWAGADLDEDPQPTMEAAEPQQAGSSTGGLSDAELDAPTREEMQVVIEDGTGSLTGSSLGRWRSWALRRQ